MQCPHPLSLRTAFGLALLLHVILLLLCTLHLHMVKPVLSQKSTQTTVQAVAVDQKAVDRIVKDLQAQKQKKITEQTRARQALATAKQQQQQAAKQLAALKQQQAASKKALAAQQAKAQQSLDKLAKQQAEAKQALGKLDAQKQAAQAALAKQQAVQAKAAAKQKAEQARVQAAAKAQKQINDEVAHYKAQIVSAISRRWQVPAKTQKAVGCLLQIQLAPGGGVLDVKVIQSSGDAALDRSAVAAVYKATPLPVPSEPNAFNAFRAFNLLVKPE